MIQVIYRDYFCLVNYIPFLESENIHLCKTIELINRLKINLKSLTSSRSESIVNRFEDILLKNKGFAEITEISYISLSGKSRKTSTNKLTNEQILCFNIAPCNSCSVERSFSKFNLVVANR